MYLVRMTGWPLPDLDYFKDELEWENVESMQDVLDRLQFYDEDDLKQLLGNVYGCKFFIAEDDEE